MSGRLLALSWLVLSAPSVLSAQAPPAQPTGDTPPVIEGAPATAATIDGLIVTWRESDLSAGNGTVTEVLGLMAPGHMRLDGRTVSSDSGSEVRGGVDNLSLIFLADPDRFLVIQRQTGEVTEIRARMIDLAEATLVQQMDESETMAAQLEPAQQADILARITAYRHYLTSYDAVHVEALPDGMSGEQACQMVSLERERLTPDGSRQRQEVSRACSVPISETRIPEWARDLLARLSRVTDRAVRLRRLTASIERGVAPPASGDDINPYAVLDTVPLHRWRLQNGQPVWEWQLLRVASLELPMAIFDPDSNVALPTVGAGTTLWSHEAGPQAIVATRAPVPAAEEPSSEDPVVLEPVMEEPAAREPAVQEPAAAAPVAAMDEPAEPAEVTTQTITARPVLPPIPDEPAETLEAPPAQADPVEVEPIEEPAVEEPVVEEPVVVEPVAGAPVVLEPVEEPVVEEPVVLEPVEEPIVEAPAATTAASSVQPTPATRPETHRAEPQPPAPRGTVSGDALARAREAFALYNKEQGQGRLRALFYQLQRGEVHITATRGSDRNATYVVLIARPDEAGVWTIVRERELTGR